MRNLRRFLRHWQNLLGIMIVLGFVVMALAAPRLSPVDPKEPGPYKRVGRITDRTPRPPSEIAALGTVGGQYDVLHSLIWGSRDATIFGLTVALGAMLFGIFYGAVAGYAGGTANSLMMRIADAFLTFPVLAAVVFLQQLVGVTISALGGVYYFNNQFFGKVMMFEGTVPPAILFLSKVDPLMIALILFSWMPYARLVNTITITLKRTDFVQAARALGGNPWWVIRRHLISNSITPAIVLGARDVSTAVILQATFTYIGIGGTSPWGTMLAIGRDWVIGPGGNLFSYWWVYVPITLAVILFGIGWSLVGDGLNDLLNVTVSDTSTLPNL